MKVVHQAVLAAVTVAILTARSDAAPLPSFRLTEISHYAPHAARNVPTQLLPLGFSFNGWIRSTMLNNGHGCNHGPSGCADGGTPGPGTPHPLDTDTNKRAPATDRHSPIEDCAQSPTGCEGKGMPPGPELHRAGEIGEGKPFLGGGCAHSPTGCAPVLPFDPGVGTREEHFTTFPHHQPSFCSQPGGCAPPPGGGTHGKKRDLTQVEGEASALAPRGKGKGGCAHSPTGCGPPSGGGGHPPHPGQTKGQTDELDEDPVQKRDLAPTDAALAARGKGQGGCAHSPTGCGPPSHGGGPSHPIHPADKKGEVEEAQVLTRAQAEDSTLAARGKGQGGCAHSPTGCGPPSHGGGGPSHPIHPEVQKRGDAQEDQKLTTTLSTTAPRARPGRSCGHSPTGCPRPPPPGSGGPNPGHGKRDSDIVDTQAQILAQTEAQAPALGLETRSRSRGGCGLSPTGCMAPSTGGPRNGNKHRRETPEPQAERAALTARGKARGGCNHSLTGCPPGGGGPHGPK